jgi:hypothetical protein
MNPPPKKIVEKALDIFRERTHLNAKYYAETTGTDQDGDGVIRIGIEGMMWDLRVHIKLNINRATIGLMKLQINNTEKGLLVTDYVNPELAEVMRNQDIAFIDAVGNAFIDNPPLYIFVKGNRPDKAQKAEPVKRLFKPGGLKVVFTLLNNPGMENETYRHMAKAANVALGTVDRVIHELKTMNFIVAMGKRSRILTDKEKLLRRWVEAYPEQLRPKLIQKRFKTDNQNWYKTVKIKDFGAFWGGEVAAAKLTGYLKPERYIIYADQNLGKLIFKYKLRVDPHGEIEVLKPFWNFNFYLADSGIVPPLLVYADLIATGDPRNIDAAEMIYDKHLVGLVRENR